VSVKRDPKRGTWTFTVDVVRPGGKRHQVRRRGFKSKREAAAAEHDLLADVKRGRYVPPSRTTLGSYLVDMWLPTLSVRPTTLDSYRRNIANHIVPALGDVPLQQLTRADVAGWVSTLGASGRLSGKSVRNVVGVLTAALGDAVEFGLVTTNVAQRLKNLPRAGTPTPRAWTIAELQRFIAHVRGDRWHALWRFLAVSECRRGEALGLRWSAVDFDAGTVSVRSQRAIAGGSVVEGAPKTTSGSRTIAVDSSMLGLLKSWRTQQLGERLMIGEGWQGDDWVFCWPDGSPLWPQTVTSWFRRYCDELGLPPIGVHGLRHTAATWMVARGESPKLVQQRLGHSHVSTTLALYAHVQPGHDRAAADALGAAIDGTP
jgi:integrase